MLSTALVLPALLAASPAVSPERAAELLEIPASACRTGEPAQRVECALERGLGGDPAALRLAVELYRKTGDVVGVYPEEEFEGGYRGVIHLVPQLPVGPQRVHLTRILAAMDEYGAFFAAVEARASSPVHFRWKGLELRFFRSVKRRTPAAFAWGWTVSYNVNGSLNTSVDLVRNLLFHEIFHLNDDGWSTRVLGDDYRHIVARCGTEVRCLEPYVPEALRVRVKGGTYYSFMPGNGVVEYAADLAVRYFKEQRAVLAGQAVPRPFKCGPPENGRAWTRLIERYFGGVDLVPPCGPR